MPHNKPLWIACQWAGWYVIRKCTLSLCHVKTAKTQTAHLHSLIRYLLFAHIICGSWRIYIVNSKDSDQTMEMRLAVVPADLSLCYSHMALWYIFSWCCQYSLGVKGGCGGQVNQILSRIQSLSFSGGKLEMLWGNFELLSNLLIANLPPTPLPPLCGSQLSLS